MVVASGPGEEALARRRIYGRAREGRPRGVEDEGGKIDVSGRRKKYAGKNLPQNKFVRSA